LYLSQSGGTKDTQCAVWSFQELAARESEPSLNRELETTLQELWETLAGNPQHRARVIARLAAHHGDAAMGVWARERIERSTVGSVAKREALALLTSSDEQPEVRVDAAEYHIRVDPELGRLAIVLKQAHLFRLWCLARDLSKERDATGQVVGSSGKVRRNALKRQLREIGSLYSDDHLNRLIRRGEGIFWNANRSQLYLRKPAHVAHHLTKQMQAAHPGEMTGNLPGVRDVYVSPAGSLEQWEATLYAGWHCHREDPTIARATLARLFGRTEQTLRNWEQRRLQGVVTPRHNYAQAPIADPFYDLYPEHAQRYATKRGEVRVTWQLPNTYCTRHIRQHPHQGQARKVRSSVKDCLSDQPLALGGMHRSDPEPPAIIRRSEPDPVGRLYFDNAKRLQRYLKRHGGIRYLWRGERRYKFVRQGIFEATESGWVETEATERLNFKAEQAFFRRLNV